MREAIFRRRASAGLPWAVFGLSLLSFLPGGSGLAETLELSDNRRLEGRLSGDLRRGFHFEPTPAGPAVRLHRGAVVTFEGDGPDPAADVPPFRVSFGLHQRISGRLGTVDAARVSLLDSSASGRPLEFRRAFVHSVSQRPGEVLVFEDGFETIDDSRWSQVGEPESSAALKVAGERSLELPAGGASLTTRLPEPVGSGRLEVAFHDGGQVAPGQQCFVDLLFRGPAGHETVRAILGWADESLAVETPGGPALAVQRLARRDGWHRLRVRFGPDRTELAVDGNDLAHGKGPGGPLVEVRLASFAAGKEPIPDHLLAHFDDLRLVRFSEPAGRLEIDASQDEVRLVGGDQVFGVVFAADPERVAIHVDGKDVTLPWSEVAGIYFRRVPAQGETLGGLLVHLQWRSAPGNDPRDLDEAEGVLAGASDRSVSLITPFAGTLEIPRDRLKRLAVLGRGRRIVIDSTAHHLGNNTATGELPLDPPQPEGGVLERTVELPEVPSGPAFLTLDVIGVIGEASGIPYSTEVKEGALRTVAKVGGKTVDYLNRHITSKNESMERIRLPIPPGVLKPGKNTIRFEQVGKAREPEELDDLGILGIALEFPAADGDPAP